MRGKIPWDRPRPGHYSVREWEIDASRSALLIVDVQRAYTDPSCGMGPILRRHYPAIHRYYYGRLSQDVLPNILLLREFFRSHHLEVIYTRMGLQLPGGQDLPPWSWRRALVNTSQDCLYPQGSPEYELLREIEPLPHELVLDKNTLSPFNSTAIDQLLHNMKVENLVIAGLLTNAAIESTAREAGDRGYNAIAVEDACATYHPAEHEASLRHPSWWVVKTTEEVFRDLGPLLPG